MHKCFVLAMLSLLAGCTLQSMTKNDRSEAATRKLTEHQLDEREALVVGDRPRIEPLQVHELTEDLTKIVMRMNQANAVLNSSGKSRTLADLLANPDAVSKLPDITRTMLRHPDLFALHTDVGVYLLVHGTLSKRDRELTIMRIGWLCQAPYEWGEHVIVAKRVGITSEEIERITQGSSAGGWSEHERAVLRAVEELYADAMISDATWAVLSKFLDERQIIELPVLVGQYQSVAYYQNSLKLRLNSGNVGLKAR